MAIIEIADFQYQNVNIIVYWILWNIIGHWLYRGSVSDNPTGVSVKPPHDLSKRILTK